MTPTQVLAAIQALATATAEMFKWLQTPQGQQVVEQSLKDRQKWDEFWQQVGNALHDLFTGKMFAWAEAVGAPSCTLLPHVCRPLREDRILFFGTEQWRAFLASSRFVPWNIMIKEHAPLGRKTAFRGFREDTPFAALQTVLHIDPYYGFFIEALVVPAPRPHRQKNQTDQPLPHPKAFGSSGH